jgi:NAD(P)-dependent dehydrogenase (short-subunit alcohol dehydrogenase family)
VATDIVPEGLDFDAASAPLIALTRAADRVGTVEDIADIVLLLANEKSRWITGQYIAGNGGMTGQ